MSKDIEKQTAAVERQAEKSQKACRAMGKGVLRRRGLKMKSDLEATEAEAKKLAQQLEEVNAKHILRRPNIAKSSNRLPWARFRREEFSESAQRLNALTAESDRLAEGLRKADGKKPEQLRQTLAETVESARNSTVEQNLCRKLV